MMKITVKVSVLRGVMSNLESLFSSTLKAWNMDMLISSLDKTKILIEYSGGGAYYRQTIPALVESEGRFSINVSHMKSFSFPGENVTFSLKEKCLSFSSGRMVGKINVQTKDAITRLKVNSEDAIKIPAKLFSRLVDSILFKPTVSDALMKMRFIANKEEKVLKVLSADRYRFAKFEYRKPRDGESEPDAPKGESKSKKEPPREAMSVKILGDFDYVFSSEFLTAIRTFFQGDLRISADNKLALMRDSSISLFYPSFQEDTTPGFESSIEGLQKSPPIFEATFFPKLALDMVSSACSVNRQEDKITLIPGSKQIQVRVSGDGVKTQCTFDVIKIKSDKDAKVVLNSVPFSEFLKLVMGFADEKTGCRMKVWKKAVALITASSFHLMPSNGSKE
jgi:hypothetical protein